MVKVQAYHADNGIFKDKKCVEECRQRKQDFTFAGVNAHHQNGIAERRIRELQETTRAMLIHATKRWPGVVTIHLWPYAIRMANQAYNATPLNAHIDKQSPNKIFDNSAVDINPKHWKPFGCPTYVLKSELQGTTGIHPKMGCEIPCRDLPRAIADPQKKCGLGPQYPYRICQPTIP